MRDWTIDEQKREKDMKRIVIIAMVCVNATLLIALVLGAGTPEATAQVIGGGTDYMTVTAKIGSSYQALYIIEMAQQRLVALKFDKTRKRLVPMGSARELTKDFR